MRERVADWVYGGESDSFPAVVGALLRERGLTLAVAESATGGELASLITEAPGASDYFLAGYRRLLGRGQASARRQSGGTARTRHRRAGDHGGAGRRRAADDGRLPSPWPPPASRVPAASEDKPIGLLHIVVDVAGRQVHQETRYSTTRTEYKRRGALEALYLLWRELKPRRE